MNTQKAALALRLLADAIEEGGDTAAPTAPPCPARRKRPEIQIDPSINVPKTAEDKARLALRKKGYAV